MQTFSHSIPLQRGVSPRPFVSASLIPWQRLRGRLTVRSESAHAASAAGSTVERIWKEAVVIGAKSSQDGYVYAGLQGREALHAVSVDQQLAVAVDTADTGGISRRVYKPPKRAPLDDEYILGIAMQHKQHLLLAAITVLLCTASNLAAPVLSGMLFEHLVQQKPVQEYAQVRHSDILTLRSHASCMWHTSLVKQYSCRDHS